MSFFRSFRGFAFPPTATVQSVLPQLRAVCCRPLLPLLLLGSFTLLVIGCDALLPFELDVTALLILPLVAVTLCRGPKVGLMAAWGVAVLKEGGDRLRWGESVAWFVTPCNVLLWGSVASLLVLLVVAAREAQQLREMEVQLRTLRQTMVTVQDIVRNRLLIVTVASDLLDAGIMPQPQHVKLLRNAVIEILALLNQLSRVDKVTVDEVVEGVQAVRIGDRAPGGG